MLSPPAMCRQLARQSGQLRTASVIETEKSQRGIGLNVVLLVQAALESEFQFVRTMDLAQHVTQLACVGLACNCHRDRYPHW